MVDEGMEPKDRLRWEKGSTWIVERTNGGWGTGTYLRPDPEG